MRSVIYKDTLANNRGADKAVLALAEGLRERAGTTKYTKYTKDGRGNCEIVVFEKKAFERRIVEPWDAVISTGTNELLDIAAAWGHAALPWPVIQQFHTNPKSQFKWKRIFRNWRIKRALGRVSAIQVLSGKFVPQVKKYGIPVHVIGNWSRFGERGTRNGERGTGNVIICPAAFARGKNQKLLIKAFAKVSADFPGWKLRLLGRDEGGYAEECRRLADELEMRVGVGEQETGKSEQGTGNRRIEFAGFCEDMAAEYGRCAFVAFPSIDEGFPLTLADAAAFAKPCVMVRDWIGTAGAGGGIAAKPTVEAYAEGLRRLMSDEALRRLMGEVARRFCLDNYSRDKILDKWEALLNDIAGTKPIQS